MRARRPGALPERRRRAARGRPGPGHRARPRRAREPLRDGRDRHRPRRAAPSVAGPVRGRRVRLHRPARRQPAGVELAVGVLRVRPPRRAARARRARARTPHDTAAGRARRPAADARDPQGDVAARRPRARRRRPARRCSTTRTRSPGSSRASRAVPRGEPRRAPRADFPDTDPALDERHTVLVRTTVRSSSTGSRPFCRTSANRTPVRVLTRSQQSLRSKLNVSGYQCMSRVPGGIRYRPKGRTACTASAGPSIASSRATSSRTSRASGARATTSGSCVPARRPSTAWPRTGTTSPSRPRRSSTTSGSTSRCRPSSGSTWS